MIVINTSDRFKRRTGLGQEVSRVVTLLVLLVFGAVAIAGVAAVIVVLVRLADSPKTESYVPHGWPAVPATAPGWYPDASDPTLLRYFDGRQWTSATRPATQ
ncbi:DUF2510 domain-containing protein [Mycobacterium asiaticum]|uniref:DUF2510 domain-containing protein n=1 Tax=Mycobacterium asiaticum TaxID=1790 RepID=A0A1A3HRX9_MYCAS|nr:DUF2510 domain-containing protein [Mycobacterium asiaticum]OBI95694.1 hypothetical protein A5661_21250 [Mycobacterium asiaticum]OBJ50992.1 hypothetical protein A9W94_27635 [Mycobacterium asiaticum]OBJ90925.1 hypothetical protein A5640_02220 [Mycobacterium asiaticum]ORA15927.1 hypothetical protein BST16_08635 [Mycobacterium asiaticum DSM 44297]